jgi:hypothetical protein
LPAQCAKGRYFQRPSPLRIFIQRKIKCCFYYTRQSAAVKSQGPFSFAPLYLSACALPAFRHFPLCPEKHPGTAKVRSHRPFRRIFSFAAEQRPLPRIEAAGGACFSETLGRSLIQR